MKKVFCLLFVLLPAYSYLSGQSSDDYKPSEILIQGVMYHDLGEYDKAIASYNLITRSDSGYLGALVEKSLTYISMKKYDSAVIVCDEAMKIPYEMDPDVFMNKGSALDESGKPEEAIATYEEGIKLYPNYVSLIYNKAITLQKMERYEEAVICYKQVLNRYPLHVMTHFRLGKLCAEEGRYTQALLSLLTYLLLDENRSRNLENLQYVNEFVSSQSEVKAKGIKGLEGDFKDIDYIITSQVALNKKYDPHCDLSSFSILRQTHAMLSKLTHNPADTGFWMQFYVPMFCKFFKEGNYNTFANCLMRATTNAQIVKYLAKQKAPMEQMQTWMGGVIYDMHKYQNIVVNGKSGEHQVYFNKRGVTSTGIMDAKGNKNGYWEFYHRNGNISASGNYSNGERDGDFTWYHENGQVQTVAHFKDGQVDGHVKNYTLRGELKSDILYKNDKYNGESCEYYSSGDLRRKRTFVDGVPNGKDIQYYANGKLALEYTSVDDKYDGEYIRYYQNGLPAIRCTYKAGKRNGKYTTYHNNGAVKLEETYTDGKSTGTYREYHPNGKLKLEGNSKNDALFGPATSYHDNGKIHENLNYDNTGKLQGICKAYTRDGILHYEQVYEKGVLVACKYYDRKGAVVADEKKKGSKMHFISYTIDGAKDDEGDFIKGKKEGLWKSYYACGTIFSETPCKNDLVEGAIKHYYKNGDLMSVYNHKANLNEKMSYDYFQNGIYKDSVNYHLDERFRYGVWFYPDGSLSSRSYYVDGVLHHWYENYAVNGRLISESYYEDGTELFMQRHDSTGKIVCKVEFKNGTGEFPVIINNVLTAKYTMKNGYLDGPTYWYFPNGKIKTSAMYLNGRRHGMWKWYDADGKMDTEGKYFFGEKDSLWNYYENGILSSELNYVNGDVQGECKYYNSYGNIYITGSYVDDTRHNTFTYYHPSGQINVVYYYDYGRMIGYSYMGKDNKLVDTIPIVNETGKIVAYYTNGQKSMEFEMKCGETEGELVRYHPNGNLWMKRTYIHDEETGPFIEYFEKGKILSSEMYKYGKKCGISEWYYENGVKKISSEYLMDSMHGKTVVKDDKGRIIFEREYYDGDLINEKKF